MMKLMMLPMIFLLILLLIIGAISMAFVTGQPDDPGFSIGINLCDEVLALKPLVLHYATYFGVEQYVWHLLAIIQVESGGRVEDVMQSSESLGLPPNSLSREESVRQGVRYFSQLRSRAELLGADMDTVLQSYNFGLTRRERGITQFEERETAKGEADRDEEEICYLPMGTAPNQPHLCGIQALYRH